MNFVLLVISVMFCLGLTHANNQRVNEGASTSRHEEPVDESMHCELIGYAERFVLLMTAQDFRDLSMTEMMNDHYPELEAFYNEINAILVAAEFGHGEIEIDLEVSARRLRYFRTTVNLFLSQIVQKACESHYRLNSFYEFDHQNGNINVHQTLNCESSECICTNNPRERSILSAPLRLPAPRRSENLIPSSQNNLDVEISAHHIIPIQLITRFLNVWLSDHPTPPDNNFNGCMQTLFGRLRRSMQKLLLVSMRNSHVFSDSLHEQGQGDIFFADGTFRISNIQNAITWMSGNIFFGPNQRGPYDPTFERTIERQLAAFDYSAEPIVGRPRLLELEQIFHRMLNFIQPSSDSNPFVRLMHGFDIFVDTALTINIEAAAPLNMHQWEELQPSVDDLRFIRPELFRALRSRRFWSVKKNSTNQRPPRSVDYYYHDDLSSDDSSTKKYPMTEAELKQRWSEFVIDMVEVHLEARSRGLSLDWSCNFTRLYDDYIFRKLEPVNDKNGDCLRFDEFLYLKISGIKDWYECNHNGESSSTRGWCSSWKRILTSFESKDNSIDHHVLYQDRASIHKRKWYLKGMRTMVYLLSSPSKTEKNVNYEFDVETLRKNLLQMIKQSSSFQTAADYYGYLTVRK